MQNDNFFTVINGVTYSYNQYVQMRDTLKEYSGMIYNRPIIQYGSPSGVHVSYVAYWGFYSRFTGDQAEFLADKVGQYGNSLAGFFGFVVGRAATPIIGAGASFIYNNRVASVQDQIRTCSRKYNQVYLRFELESGSFANSLLLLAFKGEKAFDTRMSVSCN